VKRGALFGELTDDGRQIVVIGTGPAHDQNQIGVRLHSLTALGKSAKDEYGNFTGARYYPATWPVMVQLNWTFNHNGAPQWFPSERLTEWLIREMVRRKCPPPPLPDDVCPAGLVPRDYQAEDAAVLAAGGKVLLLHEVGLGKTVISLLGLEARRRAGTGIFPMVIIVPSWQVADVWDTHIREWMPGWPKPVLHKGEGRARVQGWRDRNYILITTYATARRDAKLDTDLLPRLRPATVVADEAHFLGNDGSKQSQAVQRLARHAGTVIWASGTWLTHSMKNIYPALATLDPASFPAWERVKPRYIATRRGKGGYGEAVLGLRPEMEEEFFACLDGQILRRAKDDVLTQLPKKIYSVRRPDVPEEWMHAYRTMADQMLAELPDGTDLPAPLILEQLTRLNQLASSATDVQVDYRPDPRTGLLVPHYTVTLKRPCWKADSVLDILGERPDQPTAVFAESRQLAMITGEDCIEAGLRTAFITGEGDGPAAGPGYRITTRTRGQAVEDFQAGKLDVIMCTAGAGGMGITLTRSNCAVMMQRSWQLDLAVQPEGRIDRIGAEIHDYLEIVDIVAKGTIDQHRREVLKGKAGQAAQLYQDRRVYTELLGGLT
jgi:SNF2 family DNA or RNA helicase